MFSARIGWSETCEKLTCRYSYRLRSNDIKVKYLLPDSCSFSSMTRPVWLVSDIGCRRTGNCSIFCLKGIHKKVFNTFPKNAHTKEYVSIIPDEARRGPPPCRCPQPGRLTSGASSARPRWSSSGWWGWSDPPGAGSHVKWQCNGLLDSWTICKHLKEPRNRFPAWRACTSTLCVHKRLQILALVSIH